MAPGGGTHEAAQRGLSLSLVEECTPAVTPFCHFHLFGMRRTGLLVSYYISYVGDAGEMLKGLAAWRDV